MKKFWAYIHCKTNKSGVAPLHENGILHSNPTDQATILNRQFQSAFSESCQYVILDKLFQLPQTKLNPNNAAGPNNIRSKFLKELAPDIAPMLHVIFCVFLDTGVVPRYWRCAKISSVYNKGEKYVVENYRPISLTCICCKMEHIVTSHIMNHADVQTKTAYSKHQCEISKRMCLQKSCKAPSRIMQVRWGNNQQK